MKFTDGFWHLREGVTAHYAREIDRVEQTADSVRILARTRPLTKRGDTLNQATLTVTISSPLPDVVRVRVVHHAGRPDPVRFALESEPGAATVTAQDGAVSLRTGNLIVTVPNSGPWDLRFATVLPDGSQQPLTGLSSKSLAWMDVAPGSAVEPTPIDLRRSHRAGYVLAQLDLAVGEIVHGLGERFGPVAKNGQSVELWNRDGGTSSDQAYKNVPFYVTNRGYGVLVDDPGYVSFEVGSEAVERVQASVSGESMEFLIVRGDDPAAVLERYTALSGRAPTVPAWSYGPWLTTSFLTDYDEETVMSFVDGMRERGLPLSVFHFDCFWMREFNWCDFVWDPRTFPDPDGMLRRLHERDLRVCVWINPYIAQESPLFAEGAAAGYLVRRADGSVWQWDRWQAGMGLVDFTNPAATEWYQDKLRALLRQGVDCFKTDFGERIPTDVVWGDGADPERMHNLYAHLYNQAVHDVLVAERGEGEAVLFARSATVGGQTLPVHWGGDSTSSYASMAESLRGGLSLAWSGFAFWSHDIGGFEGTPDPDVFKRWIAFGMLSSHSRFHGSDSYRVPWMFDDDEASPTSGVSIMRQFAELKCRLTPYLLNAGREAHATGLPTMRPMAMAFPDDLACTHLDRQYMLGRDLLIAPVMTASGDVDLWLPAGEWASLLTGEHVTGGRWLREQHELDSLPVYVRPGALIPLGARADRPDTDHLELLTLLVHPSALDGWQRTVEVQGADGRTVQFTARREGSAVVVTAPEPDGWGAQLVGGERIAAIAGRVLLPLDAMPGELG